MLMGSARGGGAVSRRTLRGLYGGRVSCHVSIMYGTSSRVPSQQPGAGTKRVVGSPARLCVGLAGYLVGSIGR